MIIDEIVQTGETRQLRYVDIQNALWSKKGDAIVIRRPNGEFLTFLDYSKGGIAQSWQVAP